MAAWVPSRIRLIFRGRYDEGHAAADLWPGMLIQKDSGLNLVAHNVAGGGGEVLVAEESALRGLDITQKLPSGDDGTPYLHGAKGDIFLMLLQNGQNAAKSDKLMSAGDGTMMVNIGGVPYEITTPSTVVTNVNTETTFSNGSYTIPANALVVGDVIRIRGKVFTIAENSTNTHRFRLYIGSTALVDSTAQQFAASDPFEFDIALTIRSLTSSGTFVASGTMAASIAATWTTTPISVASTTLDSTVTQLIKVTTLASATNAGNQVRLDELKISVDNPSGRNSLVVAEEAINNSGGAGTSPMSGANTATAAFIRSRVQ